MTNLKRLHSKWEVAKLLNTYETPDKEERRIARNARRRAREPAASASRQPDPRKPRKRADKRFRKRVTIAWRLEWIAVRSKNNPTSKAIHYEARKVRV